MGVASSTLIMRQVEEGSKTERLKELAERFAFFQRWSLVDVRRALDEYGHCAHAFESRPGESAVPHPCLLYTSPSPRDGLLSRMPSSA